MTAIAAQLIDPGQLSRQQLRAVKLIRDYKLYRRAGGYGRAPVSVSLDVMRSLQGLALVRIDALAARQPFPVLTGSGMNLVAVLDQRARKQA